MDYRQALEVRDRLADSIFARLRSDLEKAPPQSRAFLGQLEVHLFDPEFRFERTYENLELDPTEVRHEFVVLTGMAPNAYARTLRLTIAKRLLRHTELRISTVGELVGYATHKTFSQAFRTFSGISPSAFRKQDQAELVFPTNLVQKLREARLEEEEAQDLARYLRIHHSAILEDHSSLHFEGLESTARSRRSVSRPELERLNAECLWTDIRDLPQEVQAEKIRHQALSFQTKALFDFLCTASRIAGRKNRSEGARIAELALIAALTMETPNVETGKCTLWAQAWTNLGIRRRIALQLDQAEHAFDQAEYFLPTDPDPALQGEILYSRAALCWYQRSYADGIQLVEQALELLETAEDQATLAQALLVHSIILPYAGRLEQGINSLSRVLEMLPAIGNPIHLGVTAQYTLARYHRESGDYGKVQQILGHLRQWTNRYQLRTYDVYITWFEGRIALDLNDATQAERLLVAAQSAFACNESHDCARMVSLDLAIAYACQGKNTEAIETIRDASTVLELWKNESPQIAKGWKKLRKATMTNSIATEDLIEIRQAVDSFQDDPASSKFFDFAAIAV